MSLEYLCLVGEAGLGGCPKVGIKGIALLCDVPASGNSSRPSHGWSLLAPYAPWELSSRNGVLGR